MHLAQTPPIGYRLIVEQNVGLGQERLEAVRDAELFRAGAGILGPAGTPAVKRLALRVQLTDGADDGGHRDALRAVGADKRIVHVNEDNHETLYLRWVNNNA